MTDSVTSSLVDDLEQNQPDVQPHAVAAEAEKEQARKDSFADLRDSQGLPFDPQIHKTNGAGDPTTSKLGKLIRKPGRKPGSGSTVAKDGNKSTTQNTGQNARAISAAATVDAIGTLGGMIGGGEWVFIKDNASGLDERARGIEAFEQYYEAKGIDDVPPGVLVLAWALSYAAPRIMQGEVTRGKLSRAKDWVLSKVFKRRAEKPVPEPKQKKAVGEMEA